MRIDRLSNPFAFCLLVFAGLCGMTGSALAAEPAPATRDEAVAPVDPGDPPGQTHFLPTRVSASAGFVARLRALRAEHGQALQQLRERLAEAAPADRPALQREIERAKLEHSSRLVMLQLDRAEAAGRAPLAAKLARRLAALRAAGAGSLPVVEGGAR